MVALSNSSPGFTQAAMCPVGAQTLLSRDRIVGTHTLCPLWDQ